MAGLCRTLSLRRGAPTLGFLRIGSLLASVLARAPIAEWADRDSTIDCRGRKGILIGSIFPFYETHLPAKQAHAQAPVRFSRSNEDERWPRDFEPPSATRSQTPAAQGCRDPLRPSHRSLKGLDFRGLSASG
jgi:hypothetical protein